MAVTHALLVPILTVLLCGRFTLQNKLPAHVLPLDIEVPQMDQQNTDEATWKLNIDLWLKNREHEIARKLCPKEIAENELNKIEQQKVIEEKNQVIEQLQQYVVNLKQNITLERFYNSKLLTEVNNLQETKEKLLVKIGFVEFQLADIPLIKTNILILSEKLNACEVDKNAVENTNIEVESSNSELRKRLEECNSTLSNEMETVEANLIEIKQLKVEASISEQNLMIIKAEKEMCHSHNLVLNQEISGIKGNLKSCETKMIVLEQQKKQNAIKIAESSTAYSKLLSELKLYFNKKFDLGVKLKQEGKYNESLETFQIVVEGREKIFGSEHFDTLMTKHWIGAVLYNLERYDEALVVNKEVFEIRRRVLGEDHKDTLYTQANMADSLRHLGRNSEALDIYKVNVEKKKKVLGENHKSTLGSMNNMAICLKNLGKNAEALKLFKEVLEKFKITLGPNHPSTKATESWIT